MGTINEALTFDDVLLLPRYSNVLPAETDISLNLSKKISTSQKTTVFLLLSIGVVFIALIFYTLETLLVFGTVYLMSIPISIYIYKNKNKKYLQKISDEDHEDIL